jgi:hypothetical protein
MASGLNLVSRMKVSMPSRLLRNPTVRGFVLVLNLALCVMLVSRLDGAGGRRARLVRSPSLWQRRVSSVLLFTGLDPCHHFAIELPSELPMAAVRGEEAKGTRMATVVSPSPPDWTMRPPAPAAACLCHRASCSKRGSANALGGQKLGGGTVASGAKA